MILLQRYDRETETVQQDRRVGKTEARQEILYTDFTDKHGLNLSKIRVQNLLCL